MNGGFPHTDIGLWDPLHCLYVRLLVHMTAQALPGLFRARVKGIGCSHRELP